MRLQTKYIILKATTIFFGALSIPWSTFTGFCFGDGRYLTGLVSLGLQTGVALVDGYIWFWVLENMKNKIQGDSIVYEHSLDKQKEGCPLAAQKSKSIEDFQPDYNSLFGFSSRHENLHRN